MKTEIYVATHKKYQMPTDNIYVPIHVGKANNDLDFGYIGDDTNNNISHKNSEYCELTALYWLWKNSQADIVGLVHYRRYFALSNNQVIMTEKSISDIFKINPDIIIAPKKKNYYIENIYNHYKNAHHIQDLINTRSVVEKNYPEYLSSFDDVMSSKKLRLYNMFIMPKATSDLYCEWLFNILFEVEKKSDVANYSNYQKRLYGFLSERLFNVWIEKNHINIMEINVFNTEKENKVNKMLNYAKRKIFKCKL